MDHERQRRVRRRCVIKGGRIEAVLAQRLFVLWPEETGHTKSRAISEPCPRADSRIHGVEHLVPTEPRKKGDNLLQRAALDLSKIVRSRISEHDLWSIATTPWPRVLRSSDSKEALR